MLASAYDVNIDGIYYNLDVENKTQLGIGKNLLTLVIGDKSFTPVSVPIDKSELSVDQKIEFLLFLRRKNPGMRILLQHKKASSASQRTSVK